MIDAHCHLFTPAVVDSVRSRGGMARLLRLDVDAGARRVGVEPLLRAAEAAGVDRCLLLPTAPPHRVRRVNDRFAEAAAGHGSLATLGTLHPSMSAVEDEIARLLDRGTAGVKLSTFSQRFALDDPEAERMFAALERAGAAGGRRPAVLLDTFVEAHRYFGADPRHLTTPERLDRLAEHHPGMDVIGAHLGGLLAPFRQLVEELTPRDNLFLDTSNATHVLDEDQVVTMVLRHGPGHLVFGTDWPWFSPRGEIPRVAAILRRAGLDEEQMERVFDGNARRLYGL